MWVLGSNRWLLANISYGLHTLIHSVAKTALCQPVPFALHSQVTIWAQGFSISRSLPASLHQRIPPAKTNYVWCLRDRKWGPLFRSKNVGRKPKTLSQMKVISSSLTFVLHWSIHVLNWLVFFNDVITTHLFNYLSLTYQGVLSPLSFLHWQTTI